MQVTRFDSALACLAAVGPYLSAREAEHNLLLGILGTLRDHPEVYPERPYLAAVGEGDQIALVAIRTPPFGLVLSEPGVEPETIPRATDALVGDLAPRAPKLPGVEGPPAVAASFVERWAVATGREARLELTERIYRLTRVVEPPWPEGDWRLAAPSDRATLIGWVVDFHAEALPAGSPMLDVAAMVDRWIGGVGRTAYLWEVDGRVVSLVAAGSPTLNGIRIGPVYTPPAERRHGYASALTAAASQHQLDGGRRLCFLFTDLANPTSNRIYQAIGYEPVADVDRYRFSVG